MSKVADNWHPQWYEMLYEQEGLSKMEHTEGKLEIMDTGVDGGKDVMLVVKPDPTDPNLIITIGRVFINRREDNTANALRIRECWNGWDELQKQRDALLTMARRYKERFDSGGLIDKETTGLYNCLRNAIVLCEK